MNWTNVRLILIREVRDQLRDRRTMFMVAVLPLLLYPLLGMAFMQIIPILSKHPADVLILGAEELDSLSDFPQLLEGGHFSEKLFDKPSGTKMLNLTILRRNVDSNGTENKLDPNIFTPEEIKKQLGQGTYRAVIEFPPGFGKRLIQFRQELINRVDSKSETGTSDLKQNPWSSLDPILHHNPANDESVFTSTRLHKVFGRWKNQVVAQNLRVSRVPKIAADPFQLTDFEGDKKDKKKPVVWSKMLPFIVLIWALVGAFYPAIDLCAGEKERGTLETLLSSPAERNEIVWGKLFTVMLFSVANAVLNLVAMSSTGLFVFKHFSSNFPGDLSESLASPPLSAFAWLLLGLLPIAALFSALTLALASLARSSKEGQYYLMPLVLVTTPLMFLPLTVGFELNLGNCLIPITGMMLLLRSLLEGNLVQAAIHAPIVLAVTLGCCWMAVRWAVDQFNKESVLFRESERLDLGLWVRHLVRDRGPTPSVASAIACVVLILVVQFFMNFANKQMPQSFGDFAFLLFVSQVVVIALPAMLMTIMLTSKPSKTLLLNRWPKFWTLPLTLLLVVAWHPVNMFLAGQVGNLYPMAPEVIEQLGKIQSLLLEAPHPWLPFLFIALLPAICEELTFRGFVLSGLRHLGHKWWSIVLSAIFFGVVHGILQQSLMATLTGCILGYLAVQTGSLLPCILFHMIHNGLGIMVAKTQPLFAAAYQDYPGMRWLIQEIEKAGPNGTVTFVYTYNWPLVVMGVLLTAVLLRWFSKLPCEETEEETLQDALAHQAAPPVTADASQTVEN